ncbi:ABC transporter substrate-binding protein [Mesobacillus sp. AQ2]|jgi:putative tryptophan/tyrosine transport system substrate-binding protein|uniref:ABC transporter substrate-binding protein n=1 Tax=Bacillaceae TaxID=186817 RepID=UPI00119CB258|nr:MULTISPECIES: ABC transporter substrate-binding protein [Bacillaceae]MCM3125802.1 ABC transporter substrate-binding protein [Mesobacillus sp. MER 33]MCM3235823.1 ABC transporter substrate-binding protein [Mesobacillus sp. MER 48]WHX40885.1 ABC transporter substrate-binding protein [Mesobacillus sp. AQ2]
MKKSLAVLLSGAMLMLAACGGGGNQASGEKKEKTVKIGITQIVEHPSLDAAREGFIAALKDAGYEEGKNLEIDYQNAQGDMNNNASIAQKFVSDKSDLILAIATPSAQAAVQATKEIPILFTAITDPVGAELVQSMEKPGGNATGTSDTHPDAIKNTIAAIKKFVPGAKKVGIIYNNGEPNSVVNVKNAKEALEAEGLEAVESTISTSSEVKQAAESMVGRVDVLYIPKDNTVVAALESVITVANDKDIPMFAGEGDSVKRGAFASYGLDYHDLGYTTGKMAVEILEGKKPADIPVGYPEKLELVVNKKAAEEEGITLTDELLKDAKVVGE